MAEQVKFTDTVVAVVGLGLIGASYALALRHLGVKKIIGVEVDEQTAERARLDGTVDVILKHGDAVLREAKIIVLALYPLALTQFVRENIQYFHEEVLLTDVTGVKGDLLKDIDLLVKPGMDFVAGHPMAGREGSGYEKARRDLFCGANYLLVTRPGNKQTHIDLLRNLALGIGAGRVVEVTIEEHDRLIAYTSNLPHLVAAALVEYLPEGKQAACFLGGSFHDATRVAEINGPLWAELLLTNKQNVLEALDNFSKELSHWRELLLNGDKQKLGTALQATARKRRDLYHD